MSTGQRTHDQIDDDIRRLYRESAYRPDMSAFKAGLGERLVSEPRVRRAGGRLGRGARRRTRRSPWRVAAVATACVVVLGALGYGAYEAVEYFTRPEEMFVIDDGTGLGPTGASTAGVFAEFDGMLPAGVTAVVGVSESSLWCLSRERGLTSVDVVITDPPVTTGMAGDLVAYTVPGEVEGSREVWLWDTRESGAESVALLDLGGVSLNVSALAMSPDGSRLAVAGPEVVAGGQPADAMASGARVFLVDVATRAVAEWQWAGDAPPEGAALGNVVWSPASDVFYVSFLPVEAGAGEGYCYRCDPDTGLSTAWGNPTELSDVSAEGELAGLGPQVWVVREGSVASVAPRPVLAATQGSLDLVRMAPDGSCVALIQGASDEAIDGEAVHSVLEVLRPSDIGWESSRTVEIPLLDIAGFAGFVEGDSLCFAVGPWGRSPDYPGRVRLGILDATTGEYQLYDEIPVDRCLRVAGVRTGPESPDISPADTATIDSTEPPGKTPSDSTASTLVPVEVPTAEPPIVGVTREVVFSAGWGDALGEFGIQRGSEPEDWIFAGPSGFWVTPDERLYILDPVNRRVQVVGTDGAVDSAIPIQTESPQDVAVAADGTVLVRGSTGVEAYSPQGESLGLVAQSADGPWMCGFVADETTVYVTCYIDVGFDSTDAPISVTKYVPVYRNGALLDPVAEWDAAPYDQPLGQGLSLRVGDGPPAEGSASEAIGNIHVLSGDDRVFSAGLTPADYGRITGIATDGGEIVVAGERVVVFDPPVLLVESVWVFSADGTPLSRADVTQSVYGALDGGGMACSQLTSGGALFTVDVTTDGMTITRYDLGTAGEGAGGTEALALPSEMPADFGFVAHYGPGRDAIDTLAGTCRKELISEYPVEAGLHLTDAEMQELYRDLVDMDIAQYDAHHLPPAGEAEVDVPWARYSLDIWIGGVSVKYVWWEDNVGATDARSEALRAWFAKLQGMIEAKPEWQALPPRSGTWDDLG
jgi:hypothetical protein